MAFGRFKVHKGTCRSRVVGIRSMLARLAGVGTFVLTTRTGIHHDANAICEMTRAFERKTLTTWSSARMQS